MALILTGSCPGETWIPVFFYLAITYSRINFLFGTCGRIGSANTHIWPDVRVTLAGI
jgi:hypothetical protein